VARVTLILLASCIGFGARASSAQVARRNVYVTRVQGEWTVVGATDPLQALDPVSRSARLSCKPCDHARLVLRDPNSLRTTTLSCKSGGTCPAEVAVADHRFEAGASIPRAARRGLFVRLGEEGFAPRVKQIGARGDERDVGLLVLPVDGRAIDVTPLASRLPPASGRYVVRFCRLEGGTDEELDDCLESRVIRTGDCDVTPVAPCAPGFVGETPAAVRIDVYVRERTMLSSVSAANGFGVLVPTALAPRAMTAVAALVRELAAVEAHVEPEELRALRAAAALDLAAALR
jgi:hypothetical protein